MTFPPDVVEAIDMILAHFWTEEEAFAQEEPECNTIFTQMLLVDAWIRSARERD